MSEPAVVERTVPAPPKASFWEDLIDIFFSPAAVFRREENKSFWPPMLFVALAIGVIVYVTFNTLEPIFDAEFTRSSAKQLAGRPQVTAEQLEMGKRIGMNAARYGISIIILGTMFVIGFFTWLLGKLVGSTQTVHAAFVVAAWSYVPRVLGAILGGAQGLVMDTSKLTSQLSISLSPARFMDPDGSNPLLYQFAGRFDLITVWVTILLAVGMYVTGKVSKGRAAVFGVLIWVLGALPALRAAFLAM